MCGIAGVFSPDFSIENRKIKLEKMLEVQQHRGPDATEQWHDTFCSLGHNRLSIIDLSSEANQPMKSSCGRYVVVFNGEIYNYLEIKKELAPFFSFQTQSDTEVLLNAYIHWGADFLHRLNGMFSIVIWDIQTQTLFIARDRFGVKPFYYYADSNKLCFASEIKTLWASGVSKSPNKKVWANYLSFGTYGMPNETFWEGIHQLPAGHFAIISKENLSTFQPKCWYDFVQRIKKLLF